MTADRRAYYIASVWVSNSQNTRLGVGRVHSRKKREALRHARSFADQWVRQGLRCRVTIRKMKEATYDR